MQHRIAMSLRLAVISSFCATGLAPFLQECDGWPIKQPKYIELYAFMKEDLNWVFQIEGDGSALEILATDGICAKDAAGRLSQRFPDNEIIALSTFLPEILGSDSAAFLALRALDFLIRLIAELRVCGHDIVTMEMVSGSATSGVFIGNPANDPRFGPRTYKLSRIDPEAAMSIFIDRTKDLAAKARNNGVTLAIELEPGPLFTINSLHALKTFCTILARDGSDDQKACFGFNLDIPHWAFLGGVTVSDLLLPAFECVRERIVHAHVSDHSKGHYCDRPPLFDDDLRRASFREWINFYCGLASRPRAGTLRHSRAISIELECCSSFKEIEDSLHYFNGLLNDM